jgi:hypothetical protein
LNSGLLTCIAGDLLLEPHLQFISFWLFWKLGLINYMPELASNRVLPHLSLPNSQDYRSEPPVPGLHQ